MVFALRERSSSGAAFCERFAITTPAVKTLMEAAAFPCRRESGPSEGFWSRVLSYFATPSESAGYGFFYGPTGMSLPTKTGGPEGLPSGDPPGDSTVTA